MAFFPFIKSFAGRLPWPRMSGRASSSVFFGNGQFSFRDFVGVNTEQAPIKPEEAGDIALNPIFAICLSWIGTTWQIAIPKIGRMNGKLFEPDPEPHPLEALLNKPNDMYGGKWLIWSLMSDYWRRGNAYMQVVRMPGTGEPIELHYVPARFMRPVPDANGFLDHYEYTPNSAMIEVDPADIVHFRFGIDPVNPLLGIEPLASGFREFVSDNGASNYQAGLLKNGGVPPIMFSPKAVKGPDGEYNILTTDQAKDLSTMLQDKLRQEPGKPRFVPGPVEMMMMAIDPDKMALNDAREEPETRIPALFGLNAVVLNLRVGGLHSTFNNVREAKAQAWEQCLIPLQDMFAEDITNRVMPMYGPSSKGKVVRYDRSNVPELQEDQSQKRKDARDDFLAGVITIQECRSEGGLETDDKTLAVLQSEKAQAMADAQALQQEPTKAAFLKRWSFETRRRRLLVERS